MKVFIHAAAATPVPLVEAMARWGKKNQLKDVEVIHIHIEGNAPHVDPDCEGKVRLFCHTGIFTSHESIQGCPGSFL